MAVSAMSRGQVRGELEQGGPPGQAGWREGPSPVLGLGEDGSPGVCSTFPNP